MLFDVERTATPRPPDLQPWRPKPEPSSLDLAFAGVRGMVGTSLHLATRAATAAVHPLATVSALRDSAEGVGEIVWAALNPAPQTPLNVEIGPYRRFTVVRQELSDYKAVKNALGRDRQRRRAVGRVGSAGRSGCGRGEFAPRASRCARSSRCRCAARTSAARSATS